MPKSDYRKSSTARRIMSRIAVRKNKGKFGIKDARYILKLFNNASIIDDTTEDLTIVAIDRSRELSRTNAMVVTVRQGQGRIPKESKERARDLVSRGQ